VVGRGVVDTTKSVKQIFLRVVFDVASGLNGSCCGADVVEAWFSRDCFGMQTFSS
jgi:hypothetical protein